jgi:hypothetical protein
MRSRAAKLWIAPLVFAYPLVAQKHVVPLDESGKNGVLEIRFVDSEGMPIPVSAMPIVTVEDASTGRKVIERRAGARTLTLQYGTYWLRVQLSPAYPVDKKIVIRDRFQVAFVCFTVAPIELPWDGNTIRGKIVTSHPEDECKWVRLISAFSETDFSETKASDNGRFTIENVRPGMYLGIVSGKTGICGITRVNIRDERRQDIELDGNGLRSSY